MSMCQSSVWFYSFFLFPWSTTNKVLKVYHRNPQALPLIPQLRRKKMSFAHSFWWQNCFWMFWYSIQFCCRSVWFGEPSTLWFASSIKFRTPQFSNPVDQFIGGVFQPHCSLGDLEICNAKFTNDDAALQAAVENRHFELNGLKLQSFDANSIGTDPHLQTFVEKVRIFCTKIQDAQAQSSRSEKIASQIDQRERSDSHNSSR